MKTDNNDKLSQQYVSVKFTLKNPQENLEKKKKSSNPGKRVEISRVSLPVLLKPSKKVLEKSKFFKEKDKIPIKNINT